MVKMYSGKSDASSDPTHLTIEDSNSSDRGISYIVKKDKQSKAVRWGRYVFMSLLLSVAVVLGVLTWKLLKSSETDLAHEQYYSITTQAIETSKHIARNKFLGASAMARVAAQTFPDKESWPLVIVKGWYDIAKYVVPTSIVGGLSLAPIVDPSIPGLQQAFEDMAYKHYEEVFPGSNAGTSGGKIKGIWAKYDNGTLLHDTTGQTPYPSEYNVLVPKTEHSQGNHPLLMMNVHFFPEQGRCVDVALGCALKRATVDQPEFVDCTSVGDLTPPKDPTDPTGPGAFVVSPIYPSNNPTTIVGFVFAKINWVEILEAIFPVAVNGIDCVVKTYGNNSQLLTQASYTVVNGSGVYRGKGDLHDTRYNGYEISEQILDETPLSNGSISYKLFLYPNEQFNDAYTTNNPTIASIGAVLIMVLTSAVFFLYDFLVRREVNAKGELLEAKRQFVRFVSHEVRTPLNSVCMGLVLLREEMAQSLGFRSASELGSFDGKTMLAHADEADGKSVEKTMSWFDLAHEVQINASSSVDVLNDLLNYDKIESGTLNLELSVVPIWELVQRTVHEFKLPAATKKIDFQLSLPFGDDQLPNEIMDLKVIGDSVRITQVVRNLVSNALKFTPENGRLMVTADWVLPSTSDAKKRSATKSFLLKNHEQVAYEWSGEFVLKVIDSGAGMTKEQLSKLFRQGVQFNVNELQSGNGSGLGLYIAKGIVHQHEGSLVAESAGLRLGTTFTMTIPLYYVPTQHKSERSVDQGRDSLMEASLPSFRILPLRILVVDDATSNRKLLVRLLTNSGHDCDQTEDGIFAVEMVREADKSDRPYDIVLLDNEMPQMNGPTAAAEIRKNGSDVFIVGITGNMMPEDVEYFRNCGAHAVLPKPFKMENLEEVLYEFNVVRDRSDTGEDSEEFRT